MVTNLVIGGPHGFGCDCNTCRDNWDRSAAWQDRLIGILYTRPIIDVGPYSRIVVKAPKPIVGESCWKCGREADLKHEKLKLHRPVCCACAWELLSESLFVDEAAS